MTILNSTIEYHDNSNNNNGGVDENHVEAEKENDEDIEAFIGKPSKRTQQQQSYSDSSGSLNSFILLLSKINLDIKKGFSRKCS